MVPAKVNCHVIHFAFPFLVPCIACLRVEFTNPLPKSLDSSLWACASLPPSFIHPLYPHWGIMPKNCVKLRLFIDELLIFPENTRTSSPSQNRACFFPIRLYVDFAFFSFANALAFHLRSCKTVDECSLNARSTAVLLLPSLEYQDCKRVEVRLYVHILTQSICQCPLCL